MKRLLGLISMLSIPFTSPVFANSFVGKVEFNKEQRQRHLSALPAIIEDASDCLKSDLERQKSFFAQHGVSPFYGDNSSFARLSSVQKKQALLNLGKDPTLLDEMEPTSCIGLVLKCLGNAFRASGQGDLWEPLRVFTMNNNVDGSALQAGLRELGWKIVYWNPDVNSNAAWDEKEKRDDPSNEDRFWGYHAWNWAMVRKPARQYYLITVDDMTSMINFNVTQPRKFKELPFFVGNAHAGYHIFAGFYGYQIEGHSTRSITNPRNIEGAEFNPLKPDGGPFGAYRSGVFAVPPGYGF